MDRSRKMDRSGTQETQGIGFYKKKKKKNLNSRADLQPWKRQWSQNEMLYGRVSRFLLHMHVGNEMQDESAPDWIQVINYFYCKIFSKLKTELSNKLL